MWILSFLFCFYFKRVRNGVCKYYCLLCQTICLWWKPSVVASGTDINVYKNNTIFHHSIVELSLEYLFVTQSSSSGFTPLRNILNCWTKKFYDLFYVHKSVYCSHYSESIHTTFQLCHLRMVLTYTYVRAWAYVGTWHMSECFVMNVLKRIDIPFGENNAKLKLRWMKEWKK